MTLKRLFAIPIAVILLVTLALAGMVAGQGWSSQARGKAAVEAVEHMRLLLRLQSQLRLERVASNFALGRPSASAEPVGRRLREARRDTDEGIAEIYARLRENDDYKITNVYRPEPYLENVRTGLVEVRAAIDALLEVGQGARGFRMLNGMMPRMIAVAEGLDVPLEQASLAVTAADPTLSGLLTEDRLAASLRDQIGLLASLLLPRFSTGQPPTDADLAQLPILLARASYLTRLIGDTIEVAGATDRIRASFAALNAIDLTVMPGRLRDAAETPVSMANEAIDELPPQRVLVPWGERITALRSAIVDATMERVTVRRAARETRFDIVMAGFGAVLCAVLESIVLLGQRVVTPLAQLGIAITRIAAGDRGTPLTLQSGTVEITEMVTAVETLRQAALIADATALRRRMTIRHRIEMLREALGIARTVQAPAQALERGVASLSEGIDATIAMIGTAPPSTLEVAADAVRVGLAEMRETAAVLDASFAAARSVQSEDRPEAEYMAHIRAVQAEVDRRDQAVRGFVLPSLVALRDAAAAASRGPGADTHGAALRDLVSDQFERIEETVATMASMRDAVTRAAAIVRDLVPDDPPMAA